MLLLSIQTILIIVTSNYVFTANSVSVNISNVVPRRDINGVIMDIHDGNTLRDEQGVYYYYGAAYGNCTEPTGDSGCDGAALGSCGFRLDHKVALYTSTDLSTWIPHPPVFNFTDHPAPGIMYCPKVLYNRVTQLWVLWYNWIADASFKESYYGVAVSSSPFGPFKVVNMYVNLTYNNTGDFNLFLDDNNEDAYIIYTSHITASGTSHQMSIEKLSPDFVGSAGTEFNSGYFGQSFVEAPAMFKRNNIYYAAFGQCCCYCQQGSPVTFYYASSPLGPYYTGQSLGSVQSQQTNIAPFIDANNELRFLWQGDRWQSAPDRIKGHDFSFFYPLEFDEYGQIMPMTFVDSFTLDMP